MKILILGGTIFVGRHMAEAALSRGHEVTLFNRGVHGADLYPEVEHLHGDRRGDLAALQERAWDAVIDTNGYVHSVVRSSAHLLADMVKHYTFISSISVYSDFSDESMDETAATETITDEQVIEAEQIVPPVHGTVARAYRMYGPLKALCEQTIEQAMPGRTLVVRPGLIVGPYDYSDRFTYWTQRIAQGGEVLAPGRPNSPVQVIDVRDLAEWTIHMIEREQIGVYNATGPDYRLTMHAMLEACRVASTNDAYFTWVSEEFVIDSGLEPWSEMPLWLPDSYKMSGHQTLNVQKALTSGLSFRPLEETARDTLVWQQTRGTSIEELQAGISRKREQQVLEAWHNSSA